MDYDLLVIGAGSGGVAAARRASLHGARVAIVEAGRVGGTCVIRGCVPKKLLMYAAQYGDALREARGYGWAIDGEPRFEMARWADAKAAETQRLEGVYRRLLADGGVELVEGRARIVSPHEVEVSGSGASRRLRAAHLLIAAGASAVRDSIAGIEEAPTSDDALDLRTLPERIAIVGGGYIGVEFAAILARLGAQVHLHVRDRLPLRGFDEDLRRHVAAALAAGGVTLHAGSAPTRVSRDGRGWQLHFADGRSDAVPWLFNATGRRPNTQGLGLEAVGLAADAQGAVPVDDHLHSAVANIHAIGDVTNRRNLTPVAIAEGRALADGLFGGRDAAVDLSRVASAVFTLPPVATLGPTEAELAAGPAPVDVYEADFRPMKQTFFGGGERSYMKLLVDARTDRVLAVHMQGADAPEIVQSLAVALTAGATKAHFDATVAVHPTAAEEFVLMRNPVRRVGGAAEPKAPVGDH
jgi:glutathione reductase (NADPH)